MFVAMVAWRQLLFTRVNGVESAGCAGNGLSFFSTLFDALNLSPWVATHPNE
jgi:hypothetical protein